MIPPPLPPPDEPHVLANLDDYLAPSQERQLRTSSAATAWYWQHRHGCPDTQCLRCRVGRALAVLSKAVLDANAAADVLCGLIPDLVDEGDRLDPAPDTPAYEEGTQLLLKTLDAVERTGIALARAMGPAEGSGLPDREVN